MNSACSISAEKQPLLLKGKNVVLIKVSSKEEKPKMKVGKSMSGILAKTVAKGHPVCFQNRNVPTWYTGVTSPIVLIETNDATGKTKIETEKSIYEVVQ